MRNVFMPVIVAVLMTIFTKSDGADRTLFDFAEPLDATRVETFATTVRQVDGGLEVTVSESGSYPYVKLMAPSENWNLASYRYLEMDVTNTGQIDIEISGWVFSPGGFGAVCSFSLNHEYWAVLAPDTKTTIQIDLQAKYPDGTTTVINSAEVGFVQVFYKSNAAVGSQVRIDEIRVTGENPDGAPDVSGRLRVPTMVEGKPEAGKRVRQTVPRYADTDIYHVLYLPPNWTPERRFPIIAEYSGNIFYHGWCYSTGRPESSSMGYGMSEGKDYIWVNLSFVDPVGKKNEVNGWGDPDATAAYCVDAIRYLCDEFGGDPGAVFLTGFSRGALACGYIGLRTEEIADVWLGFHACQHYDGDGWRSAVYEDARNIRGPRIRGRATFLTDNGGSPASKILPELGFPAVFAKSGLGAHMDIMFLDDRESNLQLRAWMADVLKNRPGTTTISGRVTSASGKGVPNVCVQSGTTHFALTDAEGYYRIESLVDGERTVIPSRETFAFTPAERSVALSGTPAESVDFEVVESNK
ncbi:carboxypeptidase regulatory-like domain-containing protein [bacterium]|nr:carboxypeptidase regulatory-like domain-containing protein [bacterium]